VSTNLITPAGVGKLSERVEELVTQTPPSLEPSVPYLGTRLKTKPFTQLENHRVNDKSSLAAVETDT